MKRDLAVVSAVLLLVLATLTRPVAGDAEEYRIAPADKLEISVYGEPDLDRELVVRPDGRISYPLVGDLEVAGKTTEEVRAELEERIQEYVPEASASVVVSDLGSLQFYVLGKVAKPGMFNVSTPITVLQALALAGGLSTFAGERNISIVRNSGAKTERLPFNYHKVKKGKDLETNILLQRGDVVLVP